VIAKMKKGETCTDFVVSSPNLCFGTDSDISIALHYFYF
jgi:hypothetical protein